MDFAKDEGGRPDAKNIYQCGLDKRSGALSRDIVSGSPLVFPLQKREGWVLYKPQKGMKIVENKGEIPRGMFLAKNDQFKRKNTKKVCVLSLLFFFIFSVSGNLIVFFPSWLEGLLVPTGSKPKDLREAV